MNEAEEIVAAYRRLAADGLLQGSSGNLSTRSGDTMLITPTGADAGLAEADLVSLDLDGRALGPGVPSSEWAMHAAIYRARPDAAAVIHTHGDAATGLACLRRPIPAFHYMVAGFGGADIPCAPYAPFGSPELAEGAAAALAHRSACLLANHGMICHGKSIAQAATAALKLEMLARQYILACQAGEPVILSEAEIAETLRRYSYYGHARIPEARDAPERSLSRA